MGDFGLSRPAISFGLRLAYRTRLRRGLTCFDPRGLLLAQQPNVLPAVELGTLSECILRQELPVLLKRPLGRRGQIVTIRTGRGP
eukprot:SAG11_NODE_26786_length_340_cov_6.041494_1_plen_84_part_01